MVKLVFGYNQVINSVTSKTPVPEGKLRSSKERNLPVVIEGIQLSRVTIPKKKGRGRDVPIGTLKSIRDQLLLRNEQFMDFVNCPMTMSDYIKAMKDKFPDTFNEVSP